MDNDYYMRQAIEQAKLAYEINEVPIGCVIVFENEIIGKGYNKRNTLKNPLYHAEMIAIYEAAQRLGDWRLEQCRLFVTVEPCPMCAGAIVQARVPDVVFGTKNAKAGCGGSILNVLNEPRFNHRVSVVEGVLQEECAALMSSFFKRFRGENK